MNKILIFFAALIAVSCSTSKTGKAQAGKSKDAGVVFEYLATTRGTDYKAAITQDSLVVSGRNAQTRHLAVSPADWEMLLAMLKDIDLEQMKTLRAPSNKNHVDAALAANLRITKGGTSYQTLTFDHGNPPQAIKPLVDKIVDMMQVFNKKKKRKNGH